MKTPVLDSVCAKRFVMSNGFSGRHIFLFRCR